MGVNTCVYLPADVRYRDVSKVIGILAGLPGAFIPFDMRRPGGYVNVEGTRCGSTGSPSMVDLVFSGQMIDGETTHSAFYHFENPDGSRCVSLKSTPFWIAVGIGLIRFFGGRIMYNDCEGGINKRMIKPRKCNSPEDGRSWDNFQKAILNIKPLTKKDLQAVKKFAAYQEA